MQHVQVETRETRKTSQGTVKMGIRLGLCAAMALVLVALPSGCGESNTAEGTGGAKSGGARTGGSANGGSATGGSVSGGSVSGGSGAGGATSQGGLPSSGGSAGTTAMDAGTGSGGASSGGASMGGASMGGASTGGASTGGTSTGGANTGGANTGGETDAMAILAKFKPTGTKAEGYEKWMNTEIGTVTVAAETLSDGNIKGPILIPPGATYDGKGQSIKPSIPKCDGSQTESQPPVFILAPGATLKNVTINPPGCDGVHLMGDNTLDNITWTDVGEDAASSRSYFPGGKITIKNSSAKSADDKVFQFNTPVQVTIQDFTATNISKMVRQNGGTSFAMSVDLINVKVSGCKEAVVRSDTSNCKVTKTNVTADCPIHLIKPK